MATRNSNLIGFSGCVTDASGLIYYIPNHGVVDFQTQTLSANVSGWANKTSWEVFE
jgi:hypothetical protein